MAPEKVFIPTKLTMLTILFASTLILMGGAAVAPALPQIQAAFPDVDPMIIDMVVTLPPLAIAVTGLMIGLMADRFGKVKVLIPSLLIFGIAGTSGFFIDDIWLLLVSRFFVGVGIAGILSCCTALITEYYQGSQRVKILGYQTAAMGLGVLILETGGGILAEYGWHQPFLIYTLGFLIFFMGIVSLREPSKEQFDSQMDSDKFNKRAIIVCYAAAFILMVILFCIPTKLATFVVETTDASSTMTGILLGLNGVLNSAMCLAYRRISMSIPRYYILSIGFLLMAGGLIMFQIANDVPTILLCTCLIGMGIGLGTTTIINTLSTNVSPSKSGAIMGGYGTALNLGQFSATFVIAALITMSGSLRGMYVSMGFIALIAAISFFIALPKVDKN